MPWKTPRFCAFSVFFMQSPSFTPWQSSRQESQGRRIAQSLCGVHPIPSDNQIRNLLNGVPPEYLYPVFRYVLKGLEQTGHLQSFRSLQDNLLLAVDGTEHFSSTHSHCDGCSTQRLKNGPTRYFHAAVTPVMVPPGQSVVISLAPEFVTPQDSTDKQDSEGVAVKCWLEREAGHLPPIVMVLGDDLYCHQPLCDQVRGRGWILP